MDPPFGLTNESWDVPWKDDQWQNAKKLLHTQRGKLFQLSYFL